MINQNRLQRMRYRLGHRIYAGNCWATAAWLCGFNVSMQSAVTDRSNRRFDWPGQWTPATAFDFLDNHCVEVSVPTRGSIAVWGYVEPNMWSDDDDPYGLEHFSVELGNGKVIHQYGMHGRIRIDRPRDVAAYGKILHYVEYQGAAA